jgi:tetratricopeptide (TPR) repeat protein
MPGSCSSLLSSTGKLARIAVVLSAAHWRVDAAAPPFADSAQSAIAAAEADLHSGHAADAEKKLRSALSQHDLPELHRALGDCLEAERDFRHAAEEYRAAAHADPSEPNLFAFGTELLKYHGYDQALQVFTYAVARFPKSARVLVGWGIAEYSVGQYEKAVDTLCQAVDLDPSDTRALTFLGKMIDVSPELSASVQQRLQRFAGLYPRNASAQYFYGLSLLPSEMAEAESRMKRASLLDPKLTEAHFQLGIMYQKQHKNKEAISEFLIAIQQEPSMKAAHYHLAQLYGLTGQAQLARQEYDFVKHQPAKSAPDDK